MNYKINEGSTVLNKTEAALKENFFHLKNNDPNSTTIFLLLVIFTLCLII